MTSTFYGLEAARSGLNASQSGISVTSQNQANANTAGYTRQVLNQLSEGPGTGASRYLLSGPEIGGGVNITGVVQIRNTFLDTRYRTQNSDNGMMQQVKSGLTDVASVVNEFSSTSSTTLQGISGQLSSLIGSLQTYSATPDDANLPQTVKSAFSTLCQTIRSDYSKVQQLESQDKADLKTVVEGNDGKGGVNEILTEISSLNRQIAAYEITGQSANDLRDQRNVDLDKLSGYADIDVSEQSNGMVTVKLHSDTSGNALISSSNTVTGLKVNGTGTGVVWDDGSATAATVKGGTVAGYLTVINGDGTGSGAYGDFGIQAMYKKLNDFTNSFVAIVNSNVPAGGKALLDISANTAEPASAVDLSSDWKTDNTLFSDNYTGTDKGSYILAYKTALGTTKMSTLNAGNSKIVSYDGSLQDFADSISTDISYQVNYYTSQAKASASQLSTLDTERKSVSSVSSDDEAVNVIKYTQSYNACARVITAIDQMLDKLINGTGVVGLS
jgi:flagellar hook-associated protein 1 FlgK